MVGMQRKHLNRKTKEGSRKNVERKELETRKNDMAFENKAFWSYRSPSIFSRVLRVISCYGGVRSFIGMRLKEGNRKEAAYVDRWRERRTCNIGP